jgi:hypothetical protein
VTIVFSFVKISDKTFLWYVGTYLSVYQITAYSLEDNSFNTYYHKDLKSHDNT